MNHASAPRRSLSLLDTTSIIVGIIIGSGLYESTSVVASSVNDVSSLLWIWLAGGALTLCGAVCYAELATTYPADGGDYVFLSRAYGRSVGFLFGWVQLVIVRPGSLGALALVFGRYANQLWPVGDSGAALYAAGAIVTLAGMNLGGVRWGAAAQDALALAKLVGLVGVVLSGLWAGRGPTALEPAPIVEPNVALAMILVLFAYSGWNEMPYVAAEVRDPRRNIGRALLLGTLVVVVIYLAVNLAMLYGLGLSGMRAPAVAARLVEQAVGPWGGRGVSLLVCLSTLGAINGMTFTGARIYYAMGQDHRLFERLGRWHEPRGVPQTAILTEAAITLTLLGQLAWWYGPTEDPFARLVAFTGPFFWLALVLSAVSLFVLRRREPEIERPFRVPGYPLVPMAFVLASAWMTWSAVNYAASQWSWEAWWGVGLVVVGLMLARFESR